MRELTTSDNCTYRIRPDNEEAFENIKKNCLDNNIKLFENGFEIELKKKPKTKD